MPKDSTIYWAFSYVERLLSLCSMDAWREVVDEQLQAVVTRSRNDETVSDYYDTAVFEYDVYLSSAEHEGSLASSLE